MRLGEVVEGTRDLGCGEGRAESLDVEGRFLGSDTWGQGGFEVCRAAPRPSMLTRMLCRRSPRRLRAVNGPTPTVPGYGCGKERRASRDAGPHCWRAGSYVCGCDPPRSSGVIQVPCHDSDDGTSSHALKSAEDSTIVQS
eukprot:3636956-Rhodomonas_salina.1